MEALRELDNVVYGNVVKMLERQKWLLQSAQLSHYSTEEEMKKLEDGYVKTIDGLMHQHHKTSEANKQEIDFVQSL